MTTMAGEQPRIRIEWGPATEGLTAVLSAALDLLVSRGRLRLVRRDEPADVVHTVGDSTAGAAGRTDSTAHRVHTVDRVPLRRGRLAPTRWWVRQERHRGGATVTWLTHGSVTAELVVASGAVPGELVHCLPIVAPLECWPGRPVDRAAVREHLGVPPGVALVLECAPVGARRTVGDWAAALDGGGSGRPDVLALRCALHADLTFGELLAAADLFVAAQRGLTADNPGAAAVAAGVPVVAVTTDSTAELVRAGHNGFVVPPDPQSVADAVRAYLDGALPRRRWQTSGPGTEPCFDELAHGLLRAYHSALTHPRQPVAGRTR